MALLCAGLWALASHDAQLAWTTADRASRVQWKLQIYWFSWLVWPLMPWLAITAFRSAGRGHRFIPILASALLVGASAFAWARFIEPQQLDVVETRLGSTCQARVALVFDIHLGLFTRQLELEGLVTRLNELRVDAVLIAGDWTYEPPRNLAEAFRPLGKVKHPMIGVMGNHDEEAPGPPLTDSLRAALTRHGVRMLDGGRTPLGQCELVGLGDERAGSARHHLRKLVAEPSAIPAGRRVALAHDPESALQLPPGFANLLLAGHTHGGQVQVPWLTTRVLGPMRFRQGHCVLDTTRLFVTSGVGMDVLPFRFRVPPRIDVLAL